MALSPKLTAADLAVGRITKALERELLAAYRNSLGVIRSELGAFYERYAVEGALTMAEVVKYNRLANLEKSVAAEIASLTGRQVRLTRKIITAVYEESFYRVAFALETEVMAKLGFGLLPSRQVQAAILNPFDRIGWPDRTREQARIAIRQIREEITRGIIQGRSYPQVARAVKERTDMAASRAMRIVQTEAHRAREEGKLASFDQAADAGVKMMKRWLSAVDEKTRPAHGAADGQTVKLDEPFIVGGERLMYPGDPAGSAEIVINCRCSARAEILGYEPKVRMARDVEGEIGEIRAYQTYAQWKAGRLDKAA